MTGASEGSGKLLARAGAGGEKTNDGQCARAAEERD